MGKTEFLFWLIASPAIAACARWMVERATADTMREWTAVLYGKLLPPPR